MRSFLGALVAAALLVPTGTPAHEHCETQIFLFTYVRTPADDPLDPQRKLGNPTITSSAIGCVLLGDQPETPPDESQTDWIYPGSDTMVVRWLGGGIPLNGTLEFDGTTYDLEFYNTTNGLVAVVDSKQIYVNPASTFAGHEAVVTVCPDEDPANCETRTYRTLA